MLSIFDTVLKVIVTFGSPFPSASLPNIGSLEPGKSADFQVLDWNHIVPAGAPPAESAHDLASRIVHRGNRAAIRQVYVAGRLAVDHARG